MTSLAALTQLISQEETRFVEVFGQPLEVQSVLQQAAKNAFLLDGRSLAGEVAIPPPVKLPLSSGGRVLPE